MELMKGLVDHGCGNDQLLDLLKLVIQKLVFYEENRRMFGGIVCSESGDDFRNGWICGLSF
uniref:Uncharacterized protein n=1 Tax=Romanomermis culicivorax TaxID=13658 RepID=A0A915JJN9_ROMCU